MSKELHTIVIDNTPRMVTVWHLMEPNVVQISTYVTPQERQAIKEAAWLDDVTIARWIRTAVREKLKEYQNAQGKAS